MSNVEIPPQAIWIVCPKGQLAGRVTVHNPVDSMMFGCPATRVPVAVPIRLGTKGEAEGVTQEKSVAPAFTVSTCPAVPMSRMGKAAAPVADGVHLMIVGKVVAVGACAPKLVTDVDIVNLSFWL
jgi:hypothetical protein